MTLTKFKQTEIGEIPEDWSLNTLGELTTYINRGSPPVYTDKKTTLVVNQRCIREGIVSYSDARFTNIDIKPVIAEKYLRPLDILINSTGEGTLGRVSQITSLSIPTTVDSHVSIVRPNAERINPVFLGFYLKWLQPQIENMAEGSTGQTELAREKIKAIVAPLPGSVEQATIVNILSSLDDKIELNTKMNKTLGEIGKALFKRWFVDFEFPDKSGKPYKSNGGKMVDSELGKIPEGWEISTIGEKLETFLGGTPSRGEHKYWINGTIPWINSGKVNEFRITEASEYITEEALNDSAAKLLPKGSVVIAITGATLGQYSLLEIDSSFNQSVVGIKENENLKKEFVYYWIALTIEKLINAQTGGAQQHINKQVVDSHTIIIPKGNILHQYYKITAPLFNQISNNCFEINGLSVVRDSLLPRLMSGKLRV